ncbi:MAG: tripartite tricarboxylate transporter substrate binding protein [Burkholderiales bacterium]|nr:tripartite tricarboxylate transporter substrate binding protein [Burkholderiales bacterium]
MNAMMNLNHTRVSGSWRIAALALCAMYVLPAAAQQWPDKPIRVILSVPAGATPDFTARLIFPGLSQQLGVSLVADNRAGGGGVIGAEIASKAAPDGYTLFISSPGALTILPHLRKGLPYDTLRDFQPVSLISVGPFVLMAHPSVPAKNIRELIALAKAQPGKLNYASAGNGVANHLAGELFKQMTGTDIVHVPYKGAPQAVSDVLAGHMQLMFNSIAPIVPHIKSGKVRVLGVASLQRSPQMPELPTIAESGVSGFEAVNWFGMFAPAKTPRAIVNRVNSAVVDTIKSPEMQARFVALGADPVGSSVEEFTAYVRRDMEKYARIVKVSGARID